MPLFYQQNINATTKLGIWKIEETESYFAETVPLQRDITHPHKRLQHLAARYLLRYLFPDFPYEEIVIADTRKPYLPNEQYHFSISHCGDYAAAIVSRSYRVGIDIEIPTPRVMKITRKFLSVKEQEQFAEPLAANDMATITLLWSAKEALFKWWSVGQVDFSEMMVLQPFTPSLYGQIPAVFKSPQADIGLTVQYEQLEHIVLAYVMS
jgi:phosphopantetheinyl transferase